MKRFLIGLAIISFALALWVGVTPSKQDSQVDKTEVVSRLQDAHGIAVDRENSARLYIATHTGLLAMMNDDKFVRISDARDDYKGFSAHPTNTDIFYTSGHSASSGNIGFQKSIDGGKSWNKISNGASGPVDFHAMAVSQVDPKIIYGVNQGQLQRSTDEGVSWELVQSAPDGIYALATSSGGEDIVYAATSNGLQVSTDKGTNWVGLNLRESISSVAVNPKDGQEILAFAVDRGLMRTSDGGKSWQKVDGYTTGLITQLAYDPQNVNVIYAINQSLEIHKTTDGAITWSKVR